MLVRRALLAGCVALACTGAAAIATRDENKPLTLQAHGATERGSVGQLPAMGLAATTTTTTTHATAARPTTGGAPTSRRSAPPPDGLVKLPPPPEIAVIPEADPTAPDPCEGTMPMQRVADANAPGAYEMDRLTGGLRLVAHSRGPAAYNPDGRRLAYVIGVEPNTRMCLGDRVTQTARTLFADGWVPTNPNWPPQWAGPQQLFYARHEFPAPNIYRFDLRTSQSTLVARNVSSMRVSPSGLQVAYAVPNDGWASGDLFVASAVGGVARHLFTNPYSAMTTLSWSPDGLSVAVGDPLFVVDVVTWDATKHVGCGGPLWGATWSALGDRLAFTTQSGECIFVLQRVSGALEQVGVGGGPTDWSPLGDRLLVAAHTEFGARSQNATLDELNLLDSNRRRVVTAPAQDGEYHYLSGQYTADGLTIRITHTVDR